jgi:hypothetical protein
MQYSFFFFLNQIKLKKLKFIRQYANQNEAKRLKNPEKIRGQYSVSKQCKS